jgi:hypothetical protein
MLAYYVEWRMRARLAPMLYDDDKAAAEAERESPVAKARRSSSVGSGSLSLFRTAPPALGVTTALGEPQKYRLQL